MDNEKFELQPPKKSTEKVLICVSNDTKQKLDKLSQQFNYSKSEIISLSIELLDKNQKNVSIKLPE